MQSAKFESIWAILKDTPLDFENSVSETLKCTICKNILINAKQSTCGCRFCEQCLLNYLNSGKDNCPGDGEDCPLQLLSEKNLTFDNFANRKISEMVVKCTNNMCDFKDCLKNLNDHIKICQYPLINEDNVDVIEESSICKFCEKEFKASEIQSLHYNIDSEELCDQYKSKCPYECGIEDIILLKNHIRVCISKPSECPFSQMGCNASSIRQIEMSDHLCKNGFEHTKLLLEMITNLANEVKTNEINSIFKDKENKDYKDRLDLVENELENVKRENDLLRTDFNNTKMELDALKRMVTDIRDNRSNESGCNPDLNDIRSAVEKNESEISSIQRQLEQNNLKYEKVFTEYIWKIDYFSRLTQDAKDYNDKRNVYSKPFFTSRNGYKLRMCLVPFSHHSGFISITFQLMQSRFDEILEWPFKYDISISILDQIGNNNKELHLFYDPSDETQMAIYQKPENDFSDGYGFPEFIKRKVLNSYPGYIKNDSVFVKFFAKPIILSE